MTVRIRAFDHTLVGSNADSREEVMGSNPTAPKILGGSSCMVKMRPKLPLQGTAKKESFWGGPITQEPKIL